MTQIACGYGFTVVAIKTDEQHKLFGTGINTDSQIGYHAPRMGHPLELLLSPAPIYIPYKSLETKVRFIIFKANNLFFIGYQSCVDIICYILFVLCSNGSHIILIFVVNS